MRVFDLKHLFLKGALLLAGIFSLHAQVENINVAAIPGPQAVLQALSANPDFQSRLAQGQAIRFMESAIYDLAFDAIGAKYDQGADQAFFDRLSSQLDAKMRRHTKVRQQIFNELDEEHRPALMRPPPEVKLYVIDHFLPPQYAELNAESIAAMRTSLEKAATRQENREAVEAKFSEPPILISFLALMLLLVYAIFKTLGALRDKHFACDVYAKSGEVMREQKRSETTVTETVTRHGYNSIGFQRPDTRSSWSSTKRFQEIFLRMEDGVEKVFEFENFQFPCREGNVLSLVYVSRADMDRAYICSYHNHNTQQTHIIPGSINAATLPPFWRGLYRLWAFYFLAGTTFYFWFTGKFDDGVGFWEIALIIVSILIQLAIANGIYTLFGKIRASFRTSGIEKKIGQTIVKTHERLTAD